VGKIKLAKTGMAQGLMNGGDMQHEGFYEDGTPVSYLIVIIVTPFFMIYGAAHAAYELWDETLNN
jgi:hypothetical protein